jgi:hypothetical protein
MDDASGVGTSRTAVEDELEEPFTEAELTALALGADPSAPLADDAVPLHVFLSQLPSTLPSWYMPAAMARPGKGWRVPVVLGLVAAFVIIEAFGLCSTFGQVVVG